jgi:hypothetical protein
MRFVVSFDTKHDDKPGLDKVKEAMEFLLFAMKKHDKNSVGELLLTHLRDHYQGLYNHLEMDLPMKTCCNRRLQMISMDSFVEDILLIPMTTSTILWLIMTSSVS